jgi:hypothetical protein
LSSRSILCCLSVYYYHVCSAIRIPRLRLRDQTGLCEYDDNRFANRADVELQQALSPFPPHSTSLFPCMLSAIRRPRSTLLCQTTSLAAPLPIARFGPTSTNSRFIRTPRHARSAAARARTQTGDGGGSGIGQAGTAGVGGDGLTRTRTSNPREVRPALSSCVGARAIADGLSQPHSWSLT